MKAKMETAIKSKSETRNDKYESSVHCPQVRILCPTCKTGILNFNSDNVGHCGNCDASFPVKNGVIDLLPELPSKKRLWRDIVDWDFFVDIYESRWWRKGLIAHAVAGIPFDREFEMIVRALNLTDKETLLDIACGPGIYTRPFARKLNRGAVVGLDLSLPMVLYASKKAQRKEIANISFIRGDAQDLPFPDNEIDAANCCGALHLFPDLSRALSEVYRILKPGGHYTVAAAKVPKNRILTKGFRDWYYRRTGVKGFFPDELALLLEEAGLTNVVCHHAVRWWVIMSGVKPE
jgi:SAM-dependent methyltransferase